MSKDTTSPSEALYGFAAWLSTRRTPVIVSRHNDSAVVADLVKRFCEVNNWEAPEKGWEHEIEMPSSED